MEVMILWDTVSSYNFLGTVSSSGKNSTEMSKTNQPIYEVPSSTNLQTHWPAQILLGIPIVQFISSDFILNQLYVNSLAKIEIQFLQ